MEAKLKADHQLFQKLQDESPVWWENLKSDPEIYIDIRKGDYLNVYHNGGSLLRLKCTKEFKAQIHTEYIPLDRTSDYQSYYFQGNDIDLVVPRPIAIDNFETESREAIKKRIRKFYPNGSEKGIQGRYVVNA